MRWWVWCLSDGRWGKESEEEVAVLPIRWLLWGVIQSKEVSSWLMWVSMKIEREIWVFISAYEPGSEKSEEEKQPM